MTQEDRMGEGRGGTGGGQCARSALNVWYHLGLGAMTQISVGFLGRVGEKLLILKVQMQAEVYQSHKG